MDKHVQRNTKIECNIHIPKNNQKVLITKPVAPNIDLNLPFLAFPLCFYSVSPPCTTFLQQLTETPSLPTLNAN